MHRAFFAIVLVALTPMPAWAQLPQPVADLIAAAIATGDAAKVDAVAGVARSAYPDDVAAIDALVALFHQARRDAAAAQAAAAQQAIREASMIEHWGGEGQVGAFQSTGNTDAVGLTAQLQLKRQGIDWEHNLRGAVDYRRSNGRTDREQFSAVYEPRYTVNDGLFAYALAQYERDRLQGFTARYAVSGGLGLRVFDTPTLDLAVKAGPAYRRTELITGPAESSIAALAGVDFDWTISDRLTLTQDANAVAEAGGTAAAFIGGDNTSINLVTGVEGRISDQLSARLSYTLDYNSAPPAGAVATDTLTRFTLVYDF
jgi:putative salt-induced outer membrane protein